MKIVIFNKSSNDDYSFLTTLTKGTRTILTRVADKNSFRGYLSSGEYDLGVFDMGAGDGLDRSSADDLSALGTPLLVIGSRPNYFRREGAEDAESNLYHLPICNLNLGQGDCLETVIALVATLSHEINNPLQSISAHVEMLLGQSKFYQSETRIKMEKISEAVVRIREVLDQLMALETLSFHDVPGGGRMLTFEKSTLKTGSQIP